MEQTIVLKEEGRYSAFPVLDVLPDGRLAIGCVSSPFGDHHGAGSGHVLRQLFSQKMGINTLLRSLFDSNLLKCIVF